MMPAWSLVPPCWAAPRGARATMHEDLRFPLCQPEPLRERIHVRTHAQMRDVVAIFQHFSHTEVVRHQVSQARGDLRQVNLLGQLAWQFGQAMGGREPVMQALTNLQNIGQTNGCDAVIAVKLLHYPTAAGPAVVAYGTGIRFLPQAPSVDEAVPASDGRAGVPAAADAAPGPSADGTA